MLKPSKELKMDDLTLKLVNAKILVICISNEFCSNQMCTDLLTYIRQSNKLTLFAVVGCGNQWKSTNAGLLLGNDVYIDFQKVGLYDQKLNELMKRIDELKLEKVSAEPTSFPPVFISYCWSNSHDAVAKGHKTDGSSLGNVRESL